MIDGAERGARGDDHREVQHDHQINHHLAAVERHEHTARAFNNPCVALEVPVDLLNERRDADGRPVQARGEMGGQRAGQPDSAREHLISAARTQRGHFACVIVLFDASLDRFPIAKGPVTPVAVHERGADSRLADTGVGPGDEYAAHHDL